MAELLAGKEFIFPSKVENLSIAERLLDDIREEYSIGEDNYGSIWVALTEAVNNAISHGNKGDESKNVVLSFSTEGKDLIFVVEDEGPGFDYNNVPDPTSPENIESPNGRGVFLMRQLADEVTFNETGSTSELRFKDVIAS